jgi:hypothetical protein
MILSIWSWLGGLFWPALKFVFRCVLCGLEQVLRADSAEEAKQIILSQGWKGPQKPGDPPGWRCSHCAGL